MRSRRGFLQASGALALDFNLLRRFEQWRALGKRPEAARVTPFTTPNAEFYLVAVDPSFRPSFEPKDVQSAWKLELAGAGGAARAYGYDELVSRATRTVHYTFECIGNPVGGQLIGNAEWHVIPLKELLAEAPGGAGRSHSVMFVGLDDFHSSVSAARALDEHAFLALKMNGEPLPGAHGFPARVILPDLYGMKQPRWLRRIALQEASDTTSYWEKRGWGGEVPVKTMSRLDPRRHALAGRRLELTGIAFAGERGVSKVEVSLDGGANWVGCELRTPTTAGVWSLWATAWTPPRPGRYDIQVRATDGRGELQTAVQHGAFPDGASGYDRETVDVAKSEA